MPTLALKSIQSSTHLHLSTKKLYDSWPDELNNRLYSTYIIRISNKVILIDQVIHASRGLCFFVTLSFQRLMFYASKHEQVFRKKTLLKKSAIQTKTIVHSSSSETCSYFLQNQILHYCSIIC